MTTSTIACRPDGPVSAIAQLPLADDERLVGLAVQDAGNQPLAAQALDVAGAQLVGAALLDLESDPVPGHGGEV